MIRRRTKPRPKRKAVSTVQRHGIGKAALPKLKQVREFCLALPGVTEKLSHGAPTFITNKRLFVYFLENHHGDGRLAVWCAAPDGAQQMLVDSDPDVYFVPPYVGPSGWVGVRLDREAAWSEISAVLEAAHQHIATKRR